ncbi:unnamed protein product [Callosobruchus maculatus]|uniref:Uncharacterized protein n=1 Tax=Callosobruchus maculatus TaxID=64391 RepID=A0A653CWC0_CALMS|nr:unnamed protein product [Callosobruchus maculatus]
MGMAIYKIDTQEARILDEVEVTSLHMINSKGGIEAAGFFTINNKLFYSMVHGIITYIIILIQLSP